MGGFRASDADRERYVDVIETAFVDGQLGDADRELRVTRALTAETLDELDLLTRDLQNQPAPVVVRRSPAPVVLEPAPVPPRAPVTWPAPPRTGPPAKLVGLLVAGVVASAVLVIAGPSSRETMEAFPPQDYSSIEDGSVPEAGYELAAADVRRFVRRYGAKFGTTDAYEVTFFDIRVDVHVPVRGSGAQLEVWSWDGSWRRDAAAQPVSGSTATVDLGTLDVTQLFENAQVARRGLGVSGARVQRVEVRPTSDGVGSVTIHVRNGSSDRATLETTPQGARVRAVPSEG